MSIDIPKQMEALLLTGHGGLDKLVYRHDVPVPIPKNNEVLIRVAASSVNNTDINTRIGWYAKSISEDTHAAKAESCENSDVSLGSWSGQALQFPRIQGADCCGYIVAVGMQVSSKRIGERVLVRPMMLHKSSLNTQLRTTFGSERDGAFAEYTTAPTEETFSIQSNWKDEELASLPCAYSTAEGLLHRSNVKTGETVFITGGSGGVGTAAIQLAKRRGAKIIAQTSKEKAQSLIELGADEICYRDDEDGIQAIGKNYVDVLIDLVGGTQWEQLLEIIKPFGRYAVAGAIAGPKVNLDLRTLYLKDLNFYGCTFHPTEVFSNLISYVENNEISPFVSKVYAFKDTVAAQEDFLLKKYVGKLALSMHTK